MAVNGLQNHKVGCKLQLHARQGSLTAKIILELFCCLFAVTNTARKQQRNSQNRFSKLFVGLSFEKWPKIGIFINDDNSTGTV